MPDTRIALSGLGGGGGQPSQGPLGTLGSLMQIKEQQMRLRAQQEAQEDDDATTAALQQFERPDDAIEHLWKGGRANAAAGLAKNVYAERKAKMDADDAMVKGHATRLEQAAQIMNGVNDEQSFQTAKPAIGALLEPMFGKAIYDQIGTNYDPAHKKSLVDWGTSRALQLNAEHQANQETMQAWQYGMNADPKTGLWSPNGMAMRDAYRRAAANRFSVANNDDQWRFTQKHLFENGTPPDIIAEFGPYGPDAAQRAAKLGMTGAQEASAETAGRRAETAEERERRLAAGGTGGGLSQKDINAIGTVADKEFQKTQDWAREVHKEDNPGKSVGGQLIETPFNVSTLSPEHQGEFVRRMLQTENDKRRKEGRQPLITAAQTAAASGDIAGYNKVADDYNSLTQGLQTLESIVPPPPGAGRPQAAAPATGGRGGGPGAAPMSFAQKQKRVGEIFAEMEGIKDPVKKAQKMTELRDLIGLASQ